MNSRGRRLLWHGMLLFVLGLLTGLVSQNFTNPRMGLSAHLEGIMNGTFLLAVGAAWNHARLSERAASVAFGTVCTEPTPTGSRLPLRPCWAPRR